LGHDPEVAAAAADPPKQIRVDVLARSHELPVGGHDVDGEQLVDREAELAHQPADPAAEGQPSEPRVRDDSGRNGEAELLRLAVELTEEHAGLGARDALLRVDTYPFHRAEVD